MKRVLIIAAIAALSGCANLNNMTPEQLAYLAQMRANSANYQQIQQQQYQTQMQGINAWGANARAGQQPAPTTNCITNYVGGTAYTHCQ